MRSCWEGSAGDPFKHRQRKEHIQEGEEKDGEADDQCREPGGDCQTRTGRSSRHGETGVSSAASLEGGLEGGLEAGLEAGLEGAVEEEGEAVGVRRNTGCPMSPDRRKSPGPLVPAGGGEAELGSGVVVCTDIMADQ